MTAEPTPAQPSRPRLWHFLLGKGYCTVAATRGVAPWDRFKPIPPESWIAAVSLGSPTDRGKWSRKRGRTIAEQRLRLACSNSRSRLPSLVDCLPAETPTKLVPTILLKSLLNLLPRWAQRAVGGAPSCHCRCHITRMSSYTSSPSDSGGQGCSITSQK